MILGQERPGSSVFTLLVGSPLSGVGIDTVLMSNSGSATTVSLFLATQGDSTTPANGLRQTMIDRLSIGASTSYSLASSIKLSPGDQVYCSSANGSVTFTASGA